MKVSNMNGFYLAAVLLIAVSTPLAAQRLDGCPTQEGAFAAVTAPSGRALDAALRSLGVGFTRDVLTIALRDPRGEVRSLAALKLKEVDDQLEIAPLLQAWLAEKETCTKEAIRFALSEAVASLAWDRNQHPGDQPWITPFQPCTTLPSPAIVLNVEQDRSATPSNPTVRITARNLTALPIPFAWHRNPEALFSVSVTDPSGLPAKITKGSERMYQPVHDLPGLITHLPSGLLLQPHEDPTWTWAVGDDFDMSAPGTYQVSLGGSVGYLDTTICSNTTSVRVGK